MHQDLLEQPDEVLPPNAKSDKIIILVLGCFLPGVTSAGLAIFYVQIGHLLPAQGRTGCHL